MSRLGVIAFVAAVTVCSAAAQTRQDASEGIQVGDWWTYDQRDEITGAVSNTYTSTVTEISPKEISTSLSFRGGDNRGIVVFDHDWNRIVNGALRYKPSDGHGVHLPLEVGKQWRMDYEERNVQSGTNWKGTSISKVAAKESITTGAGTFDTFRIERQVKEYNAADPSRVTEAQVVLWFAPQINHWVRRSVITKVDRRTLSSTIDELTGFGRKQ
jgi:hypothetical protein